MWGIVPAAGIGSRIQPLAFSKELLPVGSRFDQGTEHPKAVSQYLLERMVLAGADKICIVISQGKSDILEYYGGSFGAATLCYIIQPSPRGLCDALFRALPLVSPEERVIVGLPDTIWFPADALSRIDHSRLTFLLFPVDNPELFDAVVGDASGRVREIEVKSARAQSRWIWGAFTAPGAELHHLHELWLERNRSDQYLGTLVNAYLAAGGQAWSAPIGEAYVDVGTLRGYREAMELLAARAPASPEAVTKTPCASPTSPPSPLSASGEGVGG